MSGLICGQRAVGPRGRGVMPWSWGEPCMEGAARRAGPGGPSAGRQIGACLGWLEQR